MFALTLMVVFCLCAVPSDGAEPGLTAAIHFPYENSSIRANVPIFGLAYGKDFTSYRLEFGQGHEPKEWTLVDESTEPETHDPWAEGKVKWSKDWGVETGNLGVWRTGLSEYTYGQHWEHDLLGPYTLRLTVTDKQGREAQHSVHVIVARVVRNDIGGSVESPDGMARLEVGADSISSAFILVSLLPSGDPLLPTTEPKPAKNLLLIGTAYEFQPPGLEFMRPARLRFKFAPEKLKEVDADGKLTPEKLFICSYDPVGEEWQPLRSSVDADKGEVTAEIVQVPRYLAYYGLFADVQAPSVPELAQLPSKVQKRSLAVKGKAEPRVSVVLLLNGKEIEAASDVNGAFTIPVTLAVGDNVLTARCRDIVGNTSEPTEEHRITLEYAEPLAVREIRLLGGEGNLKRGDKLLVRVSGKDGSAEVDTMLLHVFSSETDPEGFMLEATETDRKTGVYVGQIEIGSATDAARGVIAAKKDGERIVAAWSKDETKRAEGTYADRVAPSEPGIKCENSFCWNSFGATDRRALGGWQNRTGKYGAAIGLEDDRGDCFLRMQSKSRRGSLESIAGVGGYSVKQFPVLSFSFRANPATTVDLILSIAGKGRKGIRLTDSEPFFPQIASFSGVRADNQWHQCEINLFALLKRTFPDQDDWTIEKIEFADWDGGDRIFGTKFFGQSASRGGFYDIDNFAVMRPSYDGKLTFTWSAGDDSGIEGYSYVLDRNPVTDPPEQLTGPEDTKAYEDLKDGRWWFHVKAKDTCGNWGPPSHAMVIVDTKPPEVAIEEGPNTREALPEPVLGMIIDDGAGVDAAALRLEVDGREIAGDAVSVDPKTCALLLRPERMKPYPMWFVNDFPIELKLVGLQDLAGLAIPGERKWRLIADSPVTVPAALVKLNGWCSDDPALSISADTKGDFHLAWMRTLAGDRFAQAGCYVREVAVLAGKPRDGEVAEGEGIPLHDGNQPPHFVAEVKVDKSIPHTELKIDTIPGKAEGQKQSVVILSHSEYAYRRGGLLGRYYRDTNFTVPMGERIDSFIYFFDDRKQYTPPMPGAHSAVWDGAIYMEKAEEVEIELAIWNRSPSSGKCLVDGEVVFELRPEEMTAEGFKKGKISLTQGLHEIHLEYSEPRDPWTFALFRWRDGQGWKERIREPFGSISDLYYPENLGTTFYRRNDEPEQIYIGPLPVPPGKNTLFYHTVDRAGHAEEVKQRVLQGDNPPQPAP